MNNCDKISTEDKNAFREGQSDAFSLTRLVSRADRGTDANCFNPSTSDCIGHQNVTIWCCRAPSNIRDQVRWNTCWRCVEVGHEDNYLCAVHLRNMLDTCELGKLTYFSNESRYGVILASRAKVGCIIDAQTTSESSRCCKVQNTSGFGESEASDA